MSIFEKKLVVNHNEQDVILQCVKLLLDFMYKQDPHVEYFRMRLKDSDTNPFAKELLLEWADLEGKENKLN